MAIYGMNFNRTQIPEAFAKRFAKRIRMIDITTGKKVWFTLQGVCTSETESAWMLVQANNGHRQLHREVRHTAGCDVYGIYTY